LTIDNFFVVYTVVIIATLVLFLWTLFFGHYRQPRYLDSNLQL